MSAVSVADRSVRKIFKRGEGASQEFGKEGKNQGKTILISKLEKMKTKNIKINEKKVFTENKSVFLPRFRRRPPEKGLLSDSVRFSEQICCPNSKCPNGTILRAIMTHSYFTGDPKGAAIAQSPPLNTSLVADASFSRPLTLYLLHHNLTFFAPKMVYIECSFKSDSI